jgi:hypothetical protein
MPDSASKPISVPRSHPHRFPSLFAFHTATAAMLYPYPEQPRVRIADINESPIPSSRTRAIKFISSLDYAFWSMYVHVTYSFVPVNTSCSTRLTKPTTTSVSTRSHVYVLDTFHSTVPTRRVYSAIVSVWVYRHESSPHALAPLVIPSRRKAPSAGTAPNAAQNPPSGPRPTADRNPRRSAGSD